MPPWAVLVKQGNGKKAESEATVHNCQEYECFYAFMSFTMPAALNFKLRYYHALPHSVSIISKIHKNEIETLGVDEKRIYNFFRLKVNDISLTFLDGREMGLCVNTK